MPSDSKKTGIRRKLKKTAAGKKRKKQQSKMSTPVFAVHPEKE